MNATAKKATVKKATQLTTPVADTVTTVNHSGARFLPQTGKTGKVTASSEKRAELLNALDNRGVLAVALNGTGAMAKQAQKAMGADTLESLLSSPVALSGAEINTLRAFLIGKYGEALYSRSTMANGDKLKGLDGLAVYMRVVAKSLDLRFDVAETVKAQDSARTAINTVAQIMIDLDQLIILRQIKIDNENKVTA